MHLVITDPVHQWQVDDDDISTCTHMDHTGLIKALETLRTSGSIPGSLFAYVMTNILLHVFMGTSL